MNAYVANIWDSIRTSFWFFPTVLGALAVVLSLVLPTIDAYSDMGRFAWIATTTPAARSTLSAIAGAMMAVTGTVFSITIVTLSLTSQQFGPRLLRSFMLDLPTQLTIASFLSTGLYCLLILRIVEQNERGSVPHLSVALAVALTLFSMAMLIFFVHHIAVLIQAPHVIAAVARDLDDSIERLFPELIGQSVESVDSGACETKNVVTPVGEPLTVLSTSDGYIQAVDGAGLLRLALQHGIVIRLCRRPGHYVTKENPLAEVWRLADDLIEQVTREMNEHTIVGIRRTPRQDVECAVEELVEVAVRSLSPGINDPFTANTCIDRLGSALTRLSNRDTPASHRFDDDGCLRVIIPVVTFPEVLDAAFNQIRQYSGACPAVLIRMLETFLTILDNASRPADRAALQRHADMVLRLAERTVEEPEDLKTIRGRYEAFDGSNQELNRAHS